MKITLKAEVKKHTDTPELATVIVRLYIENDGAKGELGARDMITVPAKNAEKIAELINEQP